MISTTPGATTEEQDERFQDFDLWPAERALSAMLYAQVRAVSALKAALPSLGAGAALMAERIAAGHRLIYVGAGSSGLLALIDALELPQTFGIAETQVLAMVAGGAGISDVFAGGYEDDTEAAIFEVEEAEIGEGDCVIAVSASGSTPYTLAAQRAAKRAGAATIAIACNPGAPMLAEADVAVFVDSGPEIPAGSTRMAAGTAQKAALNLLSTLAATHLGQVVGGLMVNVRPDNVKLRERAMRIVMRLAEVDADTALIALEQADFSVKDAVLVAAGGMAAPAARTVLESVGGDLRAALALVRSRE